MCHVWSKSCKIVKKKIFLAEIFFILESSRKVKCLKCLCALVIRKCSYLRIKSLHILGTTVLRLMKCILQVPIFYTWGMPSITSLYCGFQIFERSVKCRTEKSSSELKEESTVFTEDDFKKFEEEYFVNWRPMFVCVLCLSVKLCGIVVSVL